MLFISSCSANLTKTNPMLYVPNTKNIIIVALVVALVLSLLNKSCVVKSYQNENARLKKECLEKKSDTVHIILPKEQTDWHEPVLVMENGKIPEPGSNKPSRVDSFISYEKVDTGAITSDLIIAYNGLVDDYNELLSDHKKIRLYTDTAVFKNGIGVADVQVQGNKLKYIKQTLDSIRQEIITNTVVVAAKPRNILYVSGFAQGNKTDLVNAIGAGVMFKFKNELAVEGAYLRTVHDIGFIQLGVKVPIRTRKQ